MPLGTKSKNGRYRWFFKATVDGRRHRSSKLLPRGIEEAEAKKLDKELTARKWREITTSEPVRAVPLIALAVKHYVDDCIHEQKDGSHALRCLKILEPFYRGKTFEELGAVCVEYRKQHRHLSNSTVRQRLAYLRAACRYARAVHHVGTLDQVSSMRLPSGSNERHMYLKRPQILQWARKCKYPPSRALILLTFATGSRPGECCRSERVEGGLLVKDKADNRVFKPVDPKYQRYLRHWPMEYTYGWYSKHMREARRALGLGAYKQHDLRHSTASALISAGATMPEVMSVLDHMSPASAKRYQHLYDERKRELIGQMVRGKKGRTP